MRADIQIKENADIKLNRILSEAKKDYKESMSEKWPEVESVEDSFDIFNDPYIETAAKTNRNNPLIITFVYEKHDKNGKVTDTQERAMQIYLKDNDYIEGYCLDREEIRTFRMDRIVRFTGNSEAIFDELD